MASPPQVLEEKWILVRNLDALVIKVHSPDRIDVGYMQNGHKAIKEEATWNGMEWEFAPGLNGTYLRGELERKVKRGPSGP